MDANDCATYSMIRARVGMTVRQVARLSMVEEAIVRMLESGAFSGTDLANKANDGSPLGMVLSVYKHLGDMWEEALAVKRKAQERERKTLLGGS
jgi:hypothetical protein